MSLDGHVQNGVVVFDEPVALPNGTPVRVEVLTNAKAAPSQSGPEPGHFLDHYKQVIGSVHDLPADAATNHDYYLYGSPKK